MVLKPLFGKRLGGDGALSIDLLAHFKMDAMAGGTMKKNIFGKGSTIPTRQGDNAESATAEPWTLGSFHSATDTLLPGARLPVAFRSYHTHSNPVCSLDYWRSTAH